MEAQTTGGGQPSMVRILEDEAYVSSVSESTGGGQPSTVRILEGEAYVSSVSEQTTGGEVWPAARALLAFLQGGGRHLVPEGAHCLELGSGTGWLGMMVAASLNVGDVVLSEYNAGLEWLGLNVANNGGCFQCPVSVAECDWGWFGTQVLRGSAPLSADALEKMARIVEQRWDLVIGSDLVYSDHGVVGLPCCLAALARGAGSPCVLYAHTLHRFDNYDVEFFASLHRNGLVYRELTGNEASCPEASEAAPSALERSPSPMPFAELFPEQRQAIFRIAPRERAYLLGGPPENRHGVVHQSS